MKVIKMVVMILLISMFSFTNSFAEDKGWVEIQCKVPEDFKYTAVHYSFVDDKDNFYEGKLFKENNFVGRLQLPHGTYYLNDSFVVNDTRYDYIINWMPGEWEVKEQDKATLINLSVIYEPMKVNTGEDISLSEEKNGVQETAVYKERDGDRIGDGTLPLEEVKENTHKANYMAATVVALIIAILSYIILKKIRRN